MHIEVTRQAQKEWLRILVFYLEHYGERAASNLQLQYEARRDYVLRYPFTGFIEPLLINRKKQYRSAIINKYYKMVYFVDQDTIYVADFWDMRRNPDKLKMRVK